MASAEKSVVDKKGVRSGDDGPQRVSQPTLCVKTHKLEVAQQRHRLLLPCQLDFANVMSVLNLC
jgi:hypothetical protein